MEKYETAKWHGLTLRKGAQGRPGFYASNEQLNALLEKVTKSDTWTDVLYEATFRTRKGVPANLAKALARTSREAPAPVLTLVKPLATAVSTPSSTGSVSPAAQAAFNRAFELAPDTKDSHGKLASAKHAYGLVKHHNGEGLDEFLASLEPAQAA